MAGERDARRGGLHSSSVARRLGASAFGICMPVVFAAGLAAQSEPGAAPRLSAIRVPAGPDPAAWRDPAAWGGALPASVFIQAEPLEGSPSSEPTEVRVVYDDEAIYIGAWMYDAAAEEISVGEQRRDAALTRFDAFLVIFDTFHDRENGFVFATNPGGIQHDGQVVDEGRAGGGGGRRFQGGAQGGFNLNWDGNWTVSTERDEAGWYALLRIPFSTLRYGPGEVQEWGVNFGRYIGRKNEQVYWSPVPRQYNLYRLSYAGVLDQVQVPARRQVTLTPYVLASARKVPEINPEFELPTEFGADAKIGITPSLSLDLTVNTDFAQVEVDNEQVDLTRFSLFFPEKRPFFLENAGRFAVGSNRSAQMFFSRRIGIGEGGRPVPIDWGGRLSGRAGAFDVGLLRMRTGGIGGSPTGNDYTVARLAREFPNRSAVGVMYTERSATGLPGDFGRTFALDTNIGVGEFFNFTGVIGATSRSAGGESLASSAQEAVILTSDFRNADWRVTGSYDRIGDHFNPEVGFLRRSNYQEIGGSLWRYIRVPGISWLRELRPHTNYGVSYGLESGIRETTSWHVDSHIVWDNGALMSPATDWLFDGLTEPLRLATGVNAEGERTYVEIPPGEYSGWLLNPHVQTSTQAPVTWNTTLAIGHFFSGSQRGVSSQLSFQFGGSLSGELGLEYNRIQLPGPGGSFDATLASARAGYAFSPNLYVQSLVQYNTQTEVWSGNFRFGWIDSAGTGLFVVYNERQSERLDGLFDGLLERTLSIKLSRQLDVRRLGNGFAG